MSAIHLFVKYLRHICLPERKGHEKTRPPGLASQSWGLTMREPRQTLGCESAKETEPIGGGEESQAMSLEEAML